MKIILAIILLLICFLLIFRKKRIETKIVINQPIDQVWQIFTCTFSYPEWNTLFSFDQFPTRVSQKIIVDLYNEDRNVQFRMQPEVKKLDRYHLEWEGKLYMNGLFNGRHQFIFTKIDADNTLLIHAEDFHGLLVPILNYLVIQPTRLNFEKMNKSLKKYAEGTVFNKDKIMRSIE
jgi:hypothetical protein